jgi:hypothetical protein
MSACACASCVRKVLGSSLHVLSALGAPENQVGLPAAVINKFHALEIKAVLFQADIVMQRAKPRLKSRRLAVFQALYCAILC